MAHRCPDCGYFVGVELQEPELDLDVNGTEVAGECRLVLACVNCATELAESEQEVSIEFDHEHEDGGQPEVEIEDYTAMLTERGTRGHKKYYGAEIEVNLVCACGWKETLTATVEEQASHFEPVV